VSTPLRTVDVRYAPEAFDLYRAVNATERDFPLDRTAPELFRDQALRTPEAPAVRDAVEDITYRQLDERVDRIAAGLGAAGCRPGDIVALVAGRGGWFVAGFLGMLRAGVVYLPLDPRAPGARMRQLLADSRPRLVLVDEANRDVVAGLHLDLPVRRLRDVAGTPPAGTPPAAPPRVHPDDPAYVVYTSGSTGAPKGAIVHHRGMVNQLHVKISDLGIGPSDRVAQNSPQTFDISIWQMAAPLLVGAAVDVVADEIGGDPEALATAIGERGLTVLEIVPSLLRAIVDGDRVARAFGALRLLVATGEELQPQTARRWFARNAAVPLVNAYGPTECSDDVSHCHITAPPGEETARMPIGRAVANVQLWVVRPDESPDVYRLCEPGEEGELWVTGVGVGLGYLNDPEQTARAFFADPFRPGGRLYRTGDLAVMDAAGVLTYRGRRDRQVKVHGHRIELGEVESVLGRHERVLAAAVDLRARPTGRRAVAREHPGDRREPGGDGGAKILVAYVVTSGPTGPLSDWLAERLPRHMIPDRITSVERMPLTRNGKIDYRALPDPRAGRPALATPCVPPADATERAVVATWSAALGTEPIGREDDFFELDGDSLLAMVIVSRLNDRFGTALRVRDLLATRTPKELAALIRRPREGATAGDPTPGRSATGAAVRSGGGHPLSVHQQGVWFHWTIDPDSAYYNYQGTWTMRGPLDRTALGDAWVGLVTAHPLLRGRFVEEDGAPVLEYPWHEVPELAYADMSGEGPARAYELMRAEALREAQRPYDLAGEPLVHARIYRLAPELHELVLSTHEILLDGWGAAVLTRELAEHYTRALAGLPAEPTPPGRDDFTRFLEWEAREVTRERLAGQRAHWRAVLDGAPPVLRLPLDRPRTRVQSYRGDSCAAELSGDLLAGLRALGRRHGVTLFGTLLAGYGVVLGRYAGQDDVVVGVPMANRSRAELEDTVGFLINMLPIRLRLDWEQPFSAYLRAVGQQVSAALAHCEYPFPWMVQDAGVSRGTGTSPIFQTMFNMLNYPELPARAGSLDIEFNELETGFTKYELSLYAQPGGRGDLHLQLAFQTDLFERITVQRMFDGLLALYQDVVRDEDVALGDARVVDAAQLQRILDPGP
jgi:amino acid adenylation domain-containing protein